MKTIFISKWWVVLFFLFFLFLTIIYIINISIVRPISSSGVLTRTLVIDAGHGGDDGGAVAGNGTLEKDLNLQIALKLKDYMKDKNFNTILTREKDEMLCSNTEIGISKRKVEDMNKRVEIINNSNADMCISIHMNSFPQESCNGWQTFYSINSEMGKTIAENIQKCIGEKTLVNNSRLAKTIDGIKIINKTIIPTVIVECGFLSNNNELEMLEDVNYQNKIVEGIYEGILLWYNTQN